jgi:hypothetical protein
MTTYRRRLTFAGCLGLAHFFLAGMAFGQSPRINHVMPLGGKAGSTFDLAVTGQDVNGATGLHFSFPGALVEVQGSETVKPAVDMKKAPPGAKGLVSQRFKVTLPADVPLGIHDVRLVTPNGISNPRAFVVGDLEEFEEKEPNDDLPKAQKIAVNCTVNGVISTATDVDYYLFPGKKGQHIVVSCLTTSIDSKLPAEIELFTMSHKSLGRNKGYQNNDALLDAVLPADADYYVRVTCFTYTQGGTDYFYRLSVSTAPWIDAVFPPTIEPGKSAKVTVYGRNLPGGVADAGSVHDGKALEKVVVTVKAPKEGEPRTFHGYLAPLAATVDGFSFNLKNDSGTSNNVMLALAAAPVILEAGEHDTKEKAQSVAIPCEIAGQIEKTNNRDWYSFIATQGEVLTIEAFGDRLGSPVDLYYTLYNNKGAVVTTQDENAEITANQFYTRTDDPPPYRLTVPAAGEYTLMISSKFAYVQTGPRYFYTLRIVREKPDFTLVAMPLAPLSPEGVVVSQASHQAYTVYVLRQGGFTGEITLSGDNLPEGLSIQPQVIAGNQKVANLVVSAAKDAPVFSGGINVIGSAPFDLGGGERGTLVRPVRSATITWAVAQAAPTISRLDRELALAVREKAPYILTVESNDIVVSQGEKITVMVKLARQGDFKQAVNVVALNLPANLVQQPLSIAAGADSGKLTLDYKGGALPAGSKITLALRGQTLAPLAKNAQPKGAEPSNFLQACAPITVTVVPKKAAGLEVPRDILAASEGWLRIRIREDVLQNRNPANTLIAGQSMVICR